MTAGIRPNDEARIRKRIEEQAEAIRAKDIEGSVSGYTPDVLLFECREPAAICRIGCCQETLGGVTREHALVASTSRAAKRP